MSPSPDNRAVTIDHWKTDAKNLAIIVHRPQRFVHEPFFEWDIINPKVFNVTPQWTKSFAKLRQRDCPCALKGVHADIAHIPTSCSSYLTAVRLMRNSSLRTLLIFVEFNTLSLIPGCPQL